MHSHPKPSYRLEEAPRIGLVTNSIREFNAAGKQIGDRQVRAVYESLKEEGWISQDSMFVERRIFGYHEARAVAEQFARSLLDAVIVFNSAFPNGYVFPAIAMNPHLRATPVIVCASEEPNALIGSHEWTTNSVCGNDMNNHVAHYLGRYASFLDGSPASPEFRERLQRLLSVYHTVARLRNDYLGRFGDAPGGFHSASGDQLLFFKTFGTIVNSVDLLRVREVYDSMDTEGVKERVRFSEEDVRATQEEMSRGRVNLLSDPRMLHEGARLYHALRAIIQAEGFTSAAFRCWPEIQGGSFAMAPCLSIAWALAKGDVTAFACESDWPGAVIQTMGTLLSGRPAAFLDYVNWSESGELLQLGHCGIGIPGCMAPAEPALIARAEGGREDRETLKAKVLAGEVPVTDALIEHGVSRQAGVDIGPTLIGQFEYGVKTGIGIAQTPEGKLKMLVFTGESSPETARGILYSGTDLRVKDYKKLFHLKRAHGFPHHLAVALGDISQELRELCLYYGIEFISPDI